MSGWGTRIFDDGPSCWQETVDVIINSSTLLNSIDPKRLSNHLHQATLPEYNFIILTISISGIPFLAFQAVPKLYTLLS